MKLSPRNQLILVSAAIVVLAVVLVVGLVMPQFKRISDMDAKISEAGSRADQAQALLARRQEAKANAAGTDASLLELAQSVPQTPDLPSLLIELQDLAYDYNIELSSVRPQEMEDPTNGYITLPLELNIRGLWPDTVEFTQALMTLSRQVRVVSTVTDVRGEGDNEEGVVKFDDYAVETIVIINTYLIPASSGAPSSAASTTVTAP